MSYKTTLIPCDAFVEDSICNNTWGHLAPKPQISYKGYILFAYTAWKKIELLEAEFEELEMSPWLYNNLNEFVGNYIQKSFLGTSNENFAIFCFKGTYKQFKRGTYKFSGKMEQINNALLLATQKHNAI